MFEYGLCESPMVMIGSKYCYEVEVRCWVPGSTGDCYVGLAAERRASYKERVKLVTALVHLNRSALICEWKHSL